MRRFYALVLCLAVVGTFANAQLKFYDASDFPLYGKISEHTETRYERLPLHLKGEIREPLWQLGKNTTGLFLRFATNSSSIGLKWTVLNNMRMHHMTDIGIRGFDLYALQDGKWVFVNSARPATNSFENETVIISRMSEEMREFMLYFPLYDGVTSLEIGVDSTATLLQPQQNLFADRKPVIYYGTSITQGGCASRPGMVHTSILSRWLNTEFINLGFSGNAQLDYEIAEIIGKKDASLIILDFLPNVRVNQIEERAENFFDIIRRNSPDVTIIFIENPIFPYSRFDLQTYRAINEKNATLNKVFENLIARGEQNIVLIPASPEMIGADGEATVNGVHFTDLGFLRFAEFLYPIIKQYLK